MRDACRVTRYALVSLVALAIVLAGCTRMIDSDKAEDTIKAGTAQRTGSKIKSVDCPSDQTAKTGNTFRCRVVAADGTSGDVVATITDDTGRVGLRVPFHDTRATERTMAIKLTRRGGRPVSVDCPDIIARRKGVRFECATVSGKARGRVRARQIDDAATVRFTPVKGQ